MTAKSDKAAKETAQPIKWKIPPVKVLSDDCTVYIGRVIDDGEIIDQGTPYKVHEGEWVEVMPARAIKELMALSEVIDNAGGALRTICSELSNRVIAWNWTGMDGELLDQPYKNPEVLEGLTDDELMWVLGTVQSKETADERKNV